MTECLRKLGVSIDESAGDRIEVAGVGGRLPPTDRQIELHVENSGTTIRFLTAALGIHGGSYRLDGIERMRQRPIGPLVEALSRLGVDVVAESADECPPVVINSSKIGDAFGSNSDTFDHQRNDPDRPAPCRGEVSISGSMSSQYVSGLMMAAPLAPHGLEIEIKGTPVSQPYIEMTKAMMRSFGVGAAVEFSDSGGKVVIDSGQAFRSCEYAIEPDASAASYIWALPAICGGSATVSGLNRDSIQGDVRFVECLQRMGCRIDFQENSITVDGPARNGIDVNMADISDTAQTLAAVALCVKGPTRIRGIAHNRIKETDRVGNLAVELQKFGAGVDEHEDGLTIVPGPLRAATIDTWNDHRMAMAMSLVGLRQPGIVINDPGCVAKTWPNFFGDLDRMLGR